MRRKPVSLLLAASTLLFAAPAALAQDARALFHEAYYLEREEGRLEQALALYRKVAEARGADADLRARASERAAGLAEDFAADDLARLVPEDTILFAQMDHPGQQASLLLDQLGLLGEAHRIAEDRIAISPLLIEHVMGMRGAALAVTDLGLGGRPSGVLLLNPGSHEGLRGLIETALPAAGERVDPIGGFPVWKVEDEAFVCLTRRLVVASPDPRQVAAVVARLEGGGGKGGRSLAEDDRFVQAMGEHGAGLLSFYLNAEPLKPMISMMLQQEARNDPGAAVALNLLDIESLESLSGRVGVDETGLGLDLGLELEEGHRNLVFNLMRRPTVTHETLELVPEGAAFFLATAFNPKSAVAPIATDDADQPIVSLLDFGRELFGNVVDVALFGMPGASGEAAGLPDLSLVVRVNDAERSRALWELGLGTISQATGSGDPASERFGGATALRYTIQDVPVYLASKGDRLVISPNRGSVERALGGSYARSVKQDPVLGGSLGALDGSSTMLVALCPGRLAAMAAPFMSPGDYAEMQPVADLLAKTAVMVTTQHSNTRLALSARVEHIPDVSGLVGQMMAQHRAGAHHASGDDLITEYRAPKPTPHKVVKSSGGDLAALEARFEQLVEGGQRDAAIGLTQRMVASVDDAKGLNNLAWALLTDERYEGQYDYAARTLSVRSNELSDYSNWAYVDTLALAEFRTGNLSRAVEMQEKALELARDEEQERPELRESLERYRAALAESASGALVVR